jgi:hypothetical protein
MLFILRRMPTAFRHGLYKNVSIEVQGPKHDSQMTMTFRQAHIYMGGKMERRSISPSSELVFVARYIIVLYIYICQHIFSNIFIGIVAQSSRLL